MKNKITIWMEKKWLNMTKLILRCSRKSHGSLSWRKNSFNQLSERLEVVVENVNKFSKKVTKKTEQSTFLVNVTNEFELDIIENLESLSLKIKSFIYPYL